MLEPGTVAVEMVMEPPTEGIASRAFTQRFRMNLLHLVLVGDQRRHIVPQVELKCDRAGESLRQQRHEIAHELVEIHRRNLDFVLTAEGENLADEPLARWEARWISRRLFWSTAASASPCMQSSA